MANYIGHGRSNYFTVTDADIFEAFCAKWGLVEIDDGEGRVGFYPDDVVWEDHSLPGAPTDAWREDHEEPGEDGYLSEPYEGPDLLDDLATLLADRSVAVVMEVGHEKLAYVSGRATAINSRGERASLSLGDIYDVAARLGDTPTDVEG